MVKAVQINTAGECDIVNNMLQPLGGELFTRGSRHNI